MTEQIEEIQDETLTGQEVEQQTDVVDEIDQVNTEDEAKKYGWRPKESFDLAPEGWVDADRFLELPSTQVKVQRDENKSLNAKIEANQKEHEERFARLDRTAKMALQAAVEQKEAEHKRQVEAIEMRQREAVETGDTETYDRLTTEKAQIQPPQPVQVDEGPSLVEQFGDKYEWLKNPSAIQMGAALIDNNPHMRGQPAEVQVKFVNEQIQALAPKPAQQTPTVNRTDPGGLGGGRQQQRTLPPEAMKAGKEFVEQGIFKSIDAYAKVYWEQER